MTQTVIEIGAYELDAERFYDPVTHLWVTRRSDRLARCGLDPLGAETCGDIVAVSFEPVGTRVAQGAAFGYVEAAKFVGPLLAPVTGTVTEINPKPLADPSLLNAEPMGQWLVELESSTLDHELAGLISGLGDIGAWFAAEIEKFERQGMLAE